MSTLEPYKHTVVHTSAQLCLAGSLVQRTTELRSLSLSETATNSTSISATTLILSLLSNARLPLDIHRSDWSARISK